LCVGLFSAVVSDEKTRAKTAPTAHQRRRQWQAASIEVKTDAGSNIRIRAPGRLLYHSFSFSFIHVTLYVR